MLYEGYCGPEIGVYLWHQRDGEWRRQQKYVIRSQDDWEQDKAIIEGALLDWGNPADSARVI